MSKISIQPRIFISPQAPFFYRGNRSTWNTMGGTYWINCISCRRAKEWKKSLLDSESSVSRRTNCSDLSENPEKKVSHKSIVLCVGSHQSTNKSQNIKAN